MKGVQTTKKDSFSEWRKNIKERLYAQKLNIRSFIWIQLNYTTQNEQANTVQAVIFEKKDRTNLSPNLIPQITSKFQDYGFNCFYLDFSTLDASDLHHLLDMELSNNPTKVSYTDYWEYRRDTRPQSCLACDIDSIEVGANSFYCIEAAQLFDTSSKPVAITHILRTFGLRKSKVNPFQYIVQSKFANSIHSQAFILFHKIDNDILNEKETVYLLKNDTCFHNMLFDIQARFTKANEGEFIDKYSDYLTSNLQEFQNIYQCYKLLRIIY
ncbi:hypothetical protein [Psychrobacter sp. AOP31-E1-50]|uniref:hypothetical protein n=1 Tax=Psychrobacter sp. AOP31-E1-50 TaxID=3457692 RepID=UPI004036606E